MTPQETIAQQRYENGEQPSISTFIDEDTIIMGYGKLDYDFEFPLPFETIRQIHKTTSWSEKFKKEGYNRYITTNKETQEQCILGWCKEETVEQYRKENPNHLIEILT